MPRREQPKGYRDQYGPRYRRVPNSGPGFLVGLAGLCIILGAIASAILFVTYNTTHGTATCSVVDKSATSDKDGNTNYRVYTSDCGTFKVADAPFQGKFNSADTYGRITIGKRYTFQTIGWRNGFFSLFPNIISVSAP